MKAVVLLLACAPALADNSELPGFAYKQGQAALCHHASGCVVFTREDLAKWLQELRRSTAEICKRGSV